MWQTAFRQRSTGEVSYLIDQDVVSVADADAAVCMGPGLRWALMGPNLIYYLGGGPGGMHHFFEQFTGPMTALGRSRLSQPRSRTAEKDCGRRAGGGRWPLLRGAIPGA
jgi:hypothetical protein